MEINNIINLLPEFLQNFKGNNAKNLPEILNAVSNTGLLENVIGTKYSKFLPLLPLLTKLNGEGFKGLLNDSDTLTSLLPLLTQSGKTPDFLKGIDIASLAPLLPILTSSFKNSGSKDKAESATPVSADVEVSSDTFTGNPLSPLAGIADKDIIYMLNNFISSDAT